jgi:hypothetical protein
MIDFEVTVEYPRFSCWTTWPWSVSDWPAPGDDGERAMGVRAQQIRALNPSGS